ncbi:hypothetical protein ACQP3C_24700 [Escherichia coli]
MFKSSFFFLLSNATNATKEVISCNSTNISCIASQCWNGSANTAVVMRVPTYVPIPVKVDTGTFPITGTKRDFGITAALVTAITLSAAAATTAAVAMAAQVQSAETVNDIVEKNSHNINYLKIY